jgi:NAD(P)-dependent dehydrogenase (short-subunit alcohol dehydrogenase family)
LPLIVTFTVTIKGKLTEKKETKLMSKLEGKIAVVTGGSSGIGLATAKRLANDGAFVFITGRRQKELDAAVAEIGENAFGIRGDVSNSEDLDRLYETIKERKGKIDILFANAGGGEFARLGEISEQHFEKIFGGNVKGLLFTVQKALPLIGEGGSIILNASTAASSGMENFSVYCASKAAVRSFARSWMLDLKGKGIRVNAVSPGPIQTPAIDGLAETEEQVKQFTDQIVAAVPLGRIGQPEEVASAVAFLASDESSFVNGSELFTDGGMRQY